MEEENAGCFSILLIWWGISLLYTIVFYMLVGVGLFALMFLFESTRSFFRCIYDLLFTTSWWIFFAVFIIIAITVFLTHLYDSNK
ncbi:hypothetical protein V4483_25300 [Bacillus paranthracis]|uniref:hypothetical protein n=1 Tax=Bacillus paranthracis TaxID=2026186 RepID=UPI002FCDCF3E|nr:hypothetical protein [Bacillus cereus]